jgi:hypothetical protein
MKNHRSGGHTGKRMVRTPPGRVFGLQHNAAVSGQLRDRLLNDLILRQSKFKSTVRLRLARDLRMYSSSFFDRWSSTILRPHNVFHEASIAAIVQSSY